MITKQLTKKTYNHTVLYMTSPSDTILVNVNLEVAAEALEAVVANTKKVAAGQGPGAPHMDTADTLSLMISKFLEQKDFTRFVKELENYMPPE